MAGRALDFASGAEEAAVMVVHTIVGCFDFPPLVQVPKECGQNQKRENVGKIPTLPSCQSWPLSQTLRKAMIGCLAKWEFFPRFPVFGSDLVPNFVCFHLL